MLFCLLWLCQPKDTPNPQKIIIIFSLHFQSGKELLKTTDNRGVFPFRLRVPEWKEKQDLKAYTPAPGPGQNRPTRWFEAEGWALPSTRDLKELPSCPKPQFPPPHPDAAESVLAQASWWRSCDCLWCKPCLPSRTLWPSPGRFCHFIFLALLLLSPAIQKSLVFHFCWN